MNRDDVQTTGRGLEERITEGEIGLMSLSISSLNTQYILIGGQNKLAILEANILYISSIHLVLELHLI